MLYDDCALKSITSLARACVPRGCPLKHRGNNCNRSALLCLCEVCCEVLVREISVQGEESIVPVVEIRCNKSSNSEDDSVISIDHIIRKVQHVSASDIGSVIACGA